MYCWCIDVVVLGRENPKQNRGHAIPQLPQSPTPPRHALEQALVRTLGGQSMSTILTTLHQEFLDIEAASGGRQLLRRIYRHGLDLRVEEPPAPSIQTPPLESSSKPGRCGGNIRMCMVNLGAGCGWWECTGYGGGILLVWCRRGGSCVELSSRDCVCWFAVLVLVLVHAQMHVTWINTFPLQYFGHVL